MPMAAVASSSLTGFKNFSRQNKLHYGGFKSTIASSKSELFCGSIDFHLKEITRRCNGSRRLPVSRVVSPKAVSDSSSSQTCLDPDASTVLSHSLPPCLWDLILYSVIYWIPLLFWGVLLNGLSWYSWNACAVFLIRFIS